jgi:hypothetical protein
MTMMDNSKVQMVIHLILIQLTGEKKPFFKFQLEFFSSSDNIPLNLSKKPYSSSLKPNIHFSSLLSLTQQQYDSPATNRRQRERTTFDPHEETPRLLQIFTDTKHPTRYQIATICETLNGLPCRKGICQIS